MIKKDDIVNIYLRPYTRKMYEGKAQVVKVLGFNKYEVKFIKDYSPVRQMFEYLYEGEILERIIIE